MDFEANKIYVPNDLPHLVGKLRFSCARSSPFKGSAAVVRGRGSRLGLQAWELISKIAEIRAEFRKTNSLYPH